MSTFDTLNQLALNLTTSETFKSSVRGLKRFNPLESLSKNFIGGETVTNDETFVEIAEPFDERSEALAAANESSESDENVIHRLQAIVAGMFEVAQGTYRETMAANDNDERTKEQVRSWFSKVIGDASKSSLLPLLLSGTKGKSNSANLIPLAITLLKTFEQKPEVKEPTDPFKKFQQDIATSAKGFTGALFDLAQNISKSK